MTINGKIALNPYTTDLDFMELVSVGEYIQANESGKEFNLTPGRKYKLLGFNGDCIRVKNDLGIEDYYSVDYFKKIIY